MQSVDCNKLEVVNRHHARCDLYRTVDPPEAGSCPPTVSHHSTLTTGHNDSQILSFAA